MAAIEIDGVSKLFGRTTAVDDISLRVAEGEFFALVGPSGCGKSTLLSLIAGLEQPSAGTIRFDDQTVNDLPPRERDVAMVFQSYALYPHMTVAENIAFPLKLRGQAPAAIAAGVTRVAESLGLESLLRRRPNELSGGQRQRVALGRALVRRPRVFLLDEPLSNLDARLRLEMRAELKRLHAQYAITTVYVTHDQEEAMTLADRAAVLNGGRVQQCDAPMAIYDRPENLFVAGFIGSPPINILDPRLLEGRLDLSPGILRADVVIGIRPADIRVSPIPSEHALAAEVVLCEPTGSDVWVLGRRQGETLMGRGVGRERPAPGTTAYFELVVDCVHVFDRASGVRRNPEGLTGGALHA